MKGRQNRAEVLDDEGWESDVEAWEG